MLHDIFKGRMLKEKTRGRKVEGEEE